MVDGSESRPHVGEVDRNHELLDFSSILRQRLVVLCIHACFTENEWLSEVLDQPQLVSSANGLTRAFI